MVIQDLLIKIQGILTSLIPFIIGLTVFVIIWGVFQYVVHGAEEEKRAEGQKYILYGIVGIFIMLSIWGFVNILVGTFTLDNKINEGQIPKVPALKI